jgi:hypothetical protein
VNKYMDEYKCWNGGGQFVLHLDQREASHHLLASVKPALVYLSLTMGVTPGFTPVVDLLLAGAKQRARPAAGPAWKAPALSPEDLVAVLSRVFPLHDRVGLAEAAHGLPPGGGVPHPVQAGLF